MASSRDVFPTQMSGGLGPKLGALAGLMYAFCSFMAFGALLGESSPDDPAATHLKLLSDADNVNMGVVFSVLAAGALLYFASTLRSALARVEPGPGRLSGLCMGSLVAASAMVLIAPSLIRALAVRLENGHEVTAEIAASAFALGGTMAFMLGVFFGVAAIAAAVVTLRYGGLRRWFGWVSLVLGVFMATGAIGAPLMHEVGFAATGTSFLYFAVASVVVFAGIRRDAPRVAQSRKEDASRALAH